MVSVRKRLLIGAILAVVIGAGALLYFSWRERRENSIEYHKAEYLAARDASPMNAVGKCWYKLTGQVPQGTPQRIQVDKLIRHGEALVRLGYWRRETVVVSNMPVASVWGIVVKKGANLWHPDLTKEICAVGPIGTNTIAVTAVPDHIPIWERLIREVDVPNSAQ